MPVPIPDASPHISLVVCTRNRATTLPACLAALGRLKAASPFEIILVDNGSIDNTSQVISEFIKTTPIQVKLVHSLKPGLSRARNAGIQAARSEIIAFTDDDCYPAEDFLSALLLCFEDKSIAYVGGRVLLFDPADLPITIQPRNQAARLPAGTYIQPGFIHGANFAFRRSVFHRVGEFDVKLGAGTRLIAEDVDMLLRASASNFAGLYSPRVLVHHHHRRQSRIDETQILRSYAIGRGAYFCKGLCRPESRRLFVWPVLKRMGGHFVYWRFTELFRELQGAVMYWHIRNLS